MYPYFILLFFIIIIAHFSTKTKRYKNASNMLFFIAFAILTMFAGFRDLSVGTDTSNYIYRFHSNIPINYNNTIDLLTLEVGYLYIEKIAQFLSKDYWVLLILIAVIVNLGILRTIKQLSLSLPISFFILISLGSYFFFLNGARQGIAAGIYSLSYIHLIRGDFRKYSFWVFIAFLFHKTVAFTLPLYFLFRLKFSIRNLIIIILSISLLILTMWWFLKFTPSNFSNRYLNYETRGARGAGLLTIYYSVMALYFIFIQNTIKLEFLKLYNIYLNIIIINALIYIVIFLTKQDVNLLRLSLYTSFGFILIWPIVFKNTSNKNKSLLFLPFVILHLSFMYIYLSKMSRLIPYKFNTDIFNYF